MIRFILFALFSILVLNPVNAQTKERNKTVRVNKRKATPVETVITPKLDTEVNPTRPINVSIYIDHYYPYCGGAAPSYEQMNNYQAMANSNFVLVNLETGKKQIVKTDSTGHLNLLLPVGKYGIKELFKDCTFNEFLQKNTSSQGSYIQDMGEDCYKNWWASYLGEFSITDPSLIIDGHYSLSEGCFTGNNPCIVYLGPYPP